MTAFANFVCELRSSPVYAPIADDWAKAFRALELEGVHNWHARRCALAMAWILRHQERTILERVDALEKLTSLPPGPRIVRMKQLTGW
jgi:hypothetical protein